MLFWILVAWLLCVDVVCFDVRLVVGLLMSLRFVLLFVDGGLLGAALFVCVCCFGFGVCCLLAFLFGL